MLKRLLWAARGFIGNTPVAFISSIGSIFFTMFIIPEPLLTPVFTVFSVTDAPPVMLPVIICESVSISGVSIRLPVFITRFLASITLACPVT